MATARQGRAGRVGRQARVMAHRARSQIAKPPVEIADRVASVVGAAFAAWAGRFVAAVVRDIVQPSDRFKQDATVRGLFDEAGKARPDPDKIRAAFNVLEAKSADALRVNGVPTRDVLLGAERLQADWLRANTDIIKAESDLRRRVERILQDPLNEGRSVADISRMLQEQAGYSQSRAELTARDQTLKMYGQIQEARQTNAGITRYIWTTSLDERVRPDHADLDGSVQQWDDPPIVDQRTGRRGHPGSDYSCRCTAVPVLDEDDVADPAPAQEQRALRAQAVEQGRAQAPRPPRERAMVPTQTELERQRAHVEAAQAQRAAEQAADRRIAQASTGVAPAVAPLSGAEMLAQAELVEVRSRYAKAARIEITQAAENAVQGKTLRELGALDDPNSMRQGSFDFLRQDPTFRRTGNLLDDFARNAGGLPSFGIEPDGRVYLMNGRHRLTVARELGLRQIVARLIRYNAKGDALWTYIGYARV